MVYDGDGNRVSETVGGVRTKYLVADQNLTGYAQVIAEFQNGTVSRAYSYGLTLISQRLGASGSQLCFYGFDGHGSVRFLTDSTGAVTDTYDYDAFGNLISQTGTTPNNYLFAGEQFAPALGVYYNRARYYDQRQGRFWSSDEYEGCECDPISLHKYAYADLDPVNGHDPSGHEDLASITVSVGVSERLDAVDAKVKQAAGQKAKRMLVCEVGKFAVEQGLAEGVYYFLQEVAPGILVPYVGQTSDLLARIAQHVRDEKIFEPVLSFIEVAGGKEARRIVEQKIINVLTNGGLRAGVRALPNAERLIANLKNEIRLDKFAQICK